EFGRERPFHGSFSPGGEWFVAGARWQEPLGVFEVATGREAHRLQCYARTSTISPDGKRLAVSAMKDDQGGSETVLRFFDLASGREEKQFRLGDTDFFSL